MIFNGITRFLQILVCVFVCAYKRMLLGEKMYFSVISDMKIAYASLRLANASICSHQKNAAKGEGFIREKANMQRFFYVTFLSSATGK